MIYIITRTTYNRKNEMLTSDNMYAFSSEDSASDMFADIVDGIKSHADARDSNTLCDTPRDFTIKYNDGLGAKVQINLEAMEVR